MHNAALECLACLFYEKIGVCMPSTDNIHLCNVNVAVSEITSILDDFDSKRRKTIDEATALFNRAYAQREELMARIPCQNDKSIKQAIRDTEDVIDRNRRIFIEKMEMLKRSALTATKCCIMRL